MLKHKGARAWGEKQEKPSAIPTDPDIIAEARDSVGAGPNTLTSLKSDPSRCRECGEKLGAKAWPKGPKLSDGYLCERCGLKED